MSHPWAARTIVAGAWFFCLWFWISPPLPGVAIAVLGATAAIVTFADMKGTHKLLATIAVFCLMGIEIKDISRDRREADQQSAEQRRLDRESFQKIANRIDSSISQGQTQFMATIGRVDKVFDKTQVAADKASEAVDTITGGKDFAAIDILPLPTSDGGVSIRAIATHCDGKSKRCRQGNYPLRSVRIEYIEGRPPYLLDTPQQLDQVLAGTRPSFFLGDLEPHVMQAFGMTIHAPKENGAYYTFNVYALNGLVSEAMELRYNATDNRWSRGIRVTRVNDVILEDWFKGDAIKQPAVQNGALAK